MVYRPDKPLFQIATVKLFHFFKSLDLGFHIKDFSMDFICEYANRHITY